MEDGLGEQIDAEIEDAQHQVLILVLVEDGLGAMEKFSDDPIWVSLNPCFSGGWSRSINH